jgi:hypothetical protein
MTDDRARAAREEINAAIEMRGRAYMNSPRHRSRWGEGLEGQRLPGYRVVVTERTRHGRVKRHTFVLDEGTEDCPGGPYWHAARREDPPWGFGDPLPVTVTLAQGVDIPATTLAAILDALVSKARHRIDLKDIKVIVSQLGSHIAGLYTLTGEQRRLAGWALYTEILRRCTTM